MRRARRTDGNHAEIRDVLRQLCVAVEDTSDVGRGFPDLLVKTSNGMVWLVEIKDGSKPPSRQRLRAQQLEVRARWGVSYVVVSSVDQAIALATGGYRE